MSLLPALTLIMFAQIASATAYLIWHGGFILSALVVALCQFGGMGLGIDFLICLITGTRAKFLSNFGYLASTFTAVIVGILLSSAIQRFAEESIPLRAKPLISALAACETKYRKPPKVLQQLVPEFIAAIPHTGMPGFPSYVYRLLDLPERSRWELGVQRPSVDIFEPQWLIYQPVKDTGERNIPMRLCDWIRRG